jgi:hypothetical protein
MRLNNACTSANNNLLTFLIESQLKICDRVNGTKQQYSLNSGSESGHARNSNAYSIYQQSDLLIKFEGSIKFSVL